MKSDKLPSGATVFAQELNALRADARGGSLLLAHQQLGALALPTNPTNGQTISLVYNGTTVTLTGKTGSLSNPGDFAIQATAPATMAVIAAALKNPTTTTSTFIGFTGSTAANAVLVQYCGYSLPSGSTTLTIFSLNTSAASPLLTFSASTTVTGGSWTAQTMQLYVEDGAYYINGVRYFFAGGSTPTVTAPVSHPRIDVLSLDTTGTLNWTIGTESATPSAPAYPENKIPICELYNVVGETALYDNENQQSGEGYISNDVRPAMTYGPNFAAIGEDLLPDSANTRSLGSSGKQWLNIYGQNIYNNGALVAATKFGGTGADGVLSISSGTTTINLGGASYFEKNYSSISITGTGQLTFSNPSAAGCVVVLKCTGNVTITSTASPAILGDALGATSSNHGVGLTVGPSAAAGVSSNSFPSGAGSPTPSPFIIGGRGVHAVPGPFARLAVFAGAGGGQANGGNNTGGGTQSNGGIGILIECAGYLNFTGTITSKGQAGANGTGSTSWNGAFAIACGGASNDDGPSASSQYGSSPGAITMGDGGGGGGSVVILYNFLTANTGTITVTGGPGGTGGYSGQAGANGFSYVGPNTAFS